MTDAPGGPVGLSATDTVRQRAYEAHPLLDPLLRSRRRAALRFWLTVHREGRALAPSLQAMPWPGHAAAPQPPPAQMAWYAEEADRYVNSLLKDLPGPVARRLAPLGAVLRPTSWPELLGMAFEATSRRARYEARRKLYLATLLLGIDHSRSVRDGARHQALFEDTLHRTLWHDLEADAEQHLCFTLGRRSDGSRRPTVSPSPGPGERWCFRVRRIRSVGPARPIDVYHYHSRSKRDADAMPERTADGHLQLVAPQPGSPDFRRSGSILSKMIRRGFSDAQAVSDLLGAMFIVRDRADAYALERRLVDALGGPFRWRDRVDTLSLPEDRARLSRSSAGFRVLKQIVDLLVSDPAGDGTYQFPVEIQIHTLESHLETLSLGHVSGHKAYKNRQLVSELVPILFPVEVFGRAVTEAVSTLPANLLSECHELTGPETGEQALRFGKGRHKEAN